MLAGIIPIKSPKMARYMNTRVPGIHVPDALIEKLSDAQDRREVSVEIAAGIASEIRGMCRGLHIIDRKTSCRERV